MDNDETSGSARRLEAWVMWCEDATDALDKLRSEVVEKQAEMNRQTAEIQRLRAGIEDALHWTDSGGECGQRLDDLLHGGPNGT